MEERRVRVLVMVSVILLLLTGQATAKSFSDCYKGCLILCAISHPTSALSCAFKCLKDCIFNANSLLDSFGVQQTDAHNLCTLNCAYPTCTSVSSIDNPREKKVSSCVNKCSNGCSDKNSKLQ